MNNKKIGGAAAAAIGALLFGGSQILDHEARIQALEEAAGIESEDEELVGAEPIVEVEPEVEPDIEAGEPVEE